MSDTIQNFQISFADDTQVVDNEPWVRLEQVDIKTSQQNASLYDIIQMMGMAKSGLTSFMYKPPGIDYLTFTSSTMEVALDFRVFPSDMNLPYSLKLHEGQLSGKKYTTVKKEGNIVLPLGNSVRLPYLIVPGSSSFSWESPVYNKNAEIISSPSITIDPPFLTFEEDLFGIIRGNLTAKGYKHTATLSFPKTSQGRSLLRSLVQNQNYYQKITNVKCSVVCTYMNNAGEPQEEILELTIPRIILDFLAECVAGDEGVGTKVGPATGSISETVDPIDGDEESGKLKINFNCDPLVSNTDPDAKTDLTTIYYSTCTGEIIDTIRTKIGSSCDNG